MQSVLKRKFSSWTLECIGMMQMNSWSTAWWTGLMAAKYAQIMTPLPPCLTVGMRCLCLCWCAVLDFHQKVVLCILTLLQMSCCLLRCNFSNLSCAAISLRKKRLSPDSPSQQAILFKWVLWQYYVFLTALSLSSLRFGSFVWPLKGLVGCCEHFHLVNMLSKNVGLIIVWIWQFAPQLWGTSWNVW